MPDESAEIPHFWVVVPAGGAGTRLWPLSRRAEPKFLQDLTGQGRSLLQATHDRLEPLAGERFVVVTGRAHRDAVVAQLPGLDPRSVVAEPSARDSMAAIGLAAALVERRDPEAVLGSFAADHVIGDDGAFRDSVRAAVGLARDDVLVTLGIAPTGPSSAFGYLRMGDQIGDGPGRRVEAFVEKPGTETARAYLATGRYRWNAGMFVVRPGVLLDLLARWHPQFARDLRALAADPDGQAAGPDGLEERLRRGWGGLPRIALDHAVAEPAADVGLVAAVPADFGWDDVGDFASLTDLLPEGPAGDSAGEGDSPGLRVLGDPALVRAVGATGLAVPASGRMVTVVGLDDVVVVDTPDAVLVTTRAHAQEVKRAVELLQRTGRADLT